MDGTPIISGNAFIDALFNLCVDILLWLADLVGVSYNAINIWIFCIIWPTVTIVLIVIVIRQHMKIRKITGEVNGQRKGSEPADAGDEE